ncbi:MAG: LamB/YcsF family protein [Bacteroidota bacterium]
MLADTLCIHGDTPSALQIVSYLNKELPKHSIQIRK